VPDLTTLQLAEQIARAVVNRFENCAFYTADAHPAEAEEVLKALRETGHWFCRVTETEQKTFTEPMPDA